MRVSLRSRIQCPRVASASLCAGAPWYGAVVLSGSVLETRAARPPQLLHYGLGFLPLLSAACCAPLGSRAVSRDKKRAPLQPQAPRGELLDGQRGLVPSNFVDFVQDSESRLASTLGSEQDQNLINHPGLGVEAGDIFDLHSPTHVDSDVTSNGAGTLDVNLDDIGEDTVPYPRKITLIKQLAKSVIVGWEPPAVPPGWGTVSSYSVLVDKEARLSLTLGSRTKALIEKLNMAACTYRISVQCVTSRGSSDELQCTLLVGKDVVVAPSHLRVDNITQISAQLSWLPTNSNYSHVIFLNEEELDTVRAARYKYQFFNLRPNMAYKVRVLARPHQMPWQLPLEQREKKEAFVEFSTLPAGPPAPPQDVIVQAGATAATVQVSWRPPALTPAGLSNGANVTGYGVYAKGQRVAEVIFPTADGTAVDLVRLRSLEAKAVTVRTFSVQGESVDSSLAAIPPELLVPPTPHPRPAPPVKPLAGAPDTKDEPLGAHVRMDEAWEQSRAPTPRHGPGHMLEPPSLQGTGRRSPSPSRILPQPQGAPVSSTVAKAMAREAAQRVAESSRLEKRSIFLERGGLGQCTNSDEEDGYASPDPRRRAASVDDFLKGSELGKQPHCCHGDEYHTESSRGSDLSDIMEEDEEELCSEMQLEEGGRRRPSGTSHSALKERPERGSSEGALLERPELPPQPLRSQRLFSIPEVAEEDVGHCEPPRTQGVRCRPRPARPCLGHQAPRGSWLPGKHRSPGAAPHLEDFLLEDRGCRFSRWATRSPDSGLDCGSEEEELRLSFGSAPAKCGPGPGRCPCGRSPRPLLARRRTLTRQSSVEEDLEEQVGPGDLLRSGEARPSPERPGPRKHGRDVPTEPEDGRGAWTLGAALPSRRAAAGRHARPPLRVTEDPSLASAATAVRLRVQVTRASTSQTRVRLPSEPWTHCACPYSHTARRVCGNEDRLSPDFYDESELSTPGVAVWISQNAMNSEVSHGEWKALSRHRPVSTRRMVAVYDYDPRESSPNVDAEAELTFCTGDIITVFGEIDEDGFYYGELNGQKGLVPSNFLEEVPDDVEVHLSDAPTRPPASRVSRAARPPSPPQPRGSPWDPRAHVHSPGLKP
uniref:RIMS binding protein 2 n=1 Tax=Oryctolagus cuniculus TaxID=9986 RepID=A0A5F9DF23_RABIT